MKPGQLLIALMLCINFSVFGLQSNITAEQNQSQQQIVEQLQKDNKKLEERLDNQNKQIDWYRDDLRHTQDQINDNLSHWLVILTIIMTLIGIVIPFMINNRKNAIDSANQSSKTE